MYNEFMEWARSYPGSKKSEDFLNKAFIQIENKSGKYEFNFKPFTKITESDI
jgi:hypothetical protein